MVSRETVTAVASVLTSRRKASPPNPHPSHHQRQQLAPHTARQLRTLARQIDTAKSDMHKERLELQKFLVVDDDDDDDAFPSADDAAPALFEGTPPRHVDEESTDHAAVSPTAPAAPAAPQRRRRLADETFRVLSDDESIESLTSHLEALSIDDREGAAAVPASPSANPAAEPPTSPTHAPSASTSPDSHVGGDKPRPKLNARKQRLERRRAAAAAAADVRGELWGEIDDSCFFAAPILEELAEREPVVRAPVVRESVEQKPASPPKPELAEPRPDQPRPPQAKALCRRWAARAGSCKFGARCRFSHDCAKDADESAHAALACPPSPVRPSASRAPSTPRTETRVRGHRRQATPADPHSPPPTLELDEAPESAARLDSTEDALSQTSTLELGAAPEPCAPVDPYTQFLRDLWKAHSQRDPSKEGAPMFGAEIFAIDRDAAAAAVQPSKDSVKLTRAGERPRAISGRARKNGAPSRRYNKRSAIIAGGIELPCN